MAKRQDPSHRAGPAAVDDAYEVAVDRWLALTGARGGAGPTKPAKQNPSHRAGPVVTYHLPGAPVRPGDKAQQVPVAMLAPLGDRRGVLDPAALASRARQGQGPEIGG